MDEIDIDVFLEIIKTGSIHRAATALYLSSSAVSQRLYALETELGVRLFERGKGLKETVLTLKGQEFQKIALDMKYSYEQSGALKSSTIYPSLRIASVDSTISDVFLPLYKNLLYHDPYFRIHLRCYPSDDIYPQIEKHKVDMAFALFAFKHASIQVTPLFSDDMVLIVPEDSPLKGPLIHTNSLDPSREICLGMQEELYMGWGPAFKAWHTKWFDSDAIPLVSASSLHWSSLFFEGGDFWSIIPRANAIGKQAQYGLRIIELCNPPPQRTCYQLIHHKQTNISRHNIDLFNQYLYDFIRKIQLEKDITNLLV